MSQPEDFQPSKHIDTGAGHATEEGKTSGDVPAASARDEKEKMESLSEDEDEPRVEETGRAKILARPIFKPSLDHVTQEELQALEEWLESGTNSFPIFLPHKVEKLVPKLREFMETKGFRRTNTELLHTLRTHRDNVYETVSDASDENMSEWRLMNKPASEQANRFQQQVYQLKMDIKQRQLAWTEQLQTSISIICSRLEAIEQSKDVDEAKRLARELRTELQFDLEEF